MFTDSSDHISQTPPRGKLAEELTSTVANNTIPQGIRSRARFFPFLFPPLPLCAGTESVALRQKKEACSVTGAGYLSRVANDCS